MSEVTVVQLGIRHRGYVPDLSDCNEAQWGVTVLSYDKFKILNQSNVKQMVFSIVWERQEKYKKQSFVVLKGAGKGQNVLLVAKELLLFFLSTTAVGDVEFAYV